MVWIVDRVEENFAVLECGGLTFDVPKSVLPENVSEGDVLTVSKDMDKTSARAKKGDDILKDLFGR